MKTVLLLLFLTITFSAQAQTGFGLKGGVSYASYRCGDSKVIAGREAFGSTQSLPTFYLTGYLHSPVSSRVYFHPEVSLQGKGSIIKETQYMGGWEIEQKTKWLDFAFNFLGEVPAGNFGDFFIGGGPYIGFAMDGTNKYTEKGTTTAVIIYQDNALKNFDCGVNLLTGLKFAKRFSINANYRLGLTSIAEKYFKWSDEVRNQVFSLGLGVSL